MSIETATKVEIEAAREAVARLEVNLQQYAQGSIVAGAVPAAFVTETDALVVAADAALAVIIAG
jgi:hypothetical protein